MIINQQFKNYFQANLNFLKKYFLYRSTTFSKNNAVAKWLKSWTYWIWYLLKIPIFETIWGILIFPLMMYFLSLECLEDFSDFLVPTSANADTLELNQFFRLILSFINATLLILYSINAVLIWVSGALIILSVFTQEFNKFLSHPPLAIWKIDVM